MRSTSPARPLLRDERAAAGRPTYDDGTAAALLGVALLSTIAVQVPLHGRLAEGHDDELAHRLITSNWLRTGAWTARGLVLAAVLAT